MDTITLPTPDTIRQRMTLCRQELASLRKALRLSLALHQADEARELRAPQPTRSGQESDGAAR